ncbi:MAG: DctP family TRAP transporter solute-binding subunit [Sphaerochaetaceae bacterium]|nr:DctP family TRAP transporter solute-binding subunit [Sphaerochaetaceae bacterium]MDX9938400.1 DctP family TRAP transporter solute-binding subunit [Sphaerochaetaceae bacterium]
MRKTLRMVMMMVMVVALALPLFAGGAQEGAPVADKPVVLKVAHVGAPISPQQGAADLFVKLVTEKTGGSVDIQVFGSSTLGDEAALVEGMVLGTIDGGIVSAGLYGGYYPLMGAFEIPFLFRDRAHTIAVNNGPLGKEILDNLSKQAKLKGLAIWEHGFRHVTNNVRAIKTPQDFKGLNIRSPEVPVYSAPLRALGANPVPMAFSELYVALERGVVDGQHNPLLHVQGQRFYEVQKHLSMLDFAYTPNVLAFSNKAWGRLSATQQAQVQAAADEAGIAWSQAAEAEENRLIAELKGKMQVIDRSELDKAAFQKIVVDNTFPMFREMFGDFLDKIIATGK